MATTILRARPAWPCVRATMLLIWMMTLCVSAHDPYLTNTLPLTSVYDFSYAYVTGLAAYVDALVQDTQPGRTSRWSWDYASGTGYAASVAPQRARLAAMLGVDAAATTVFSNDWQRGINDGVAYYPWATSAYAKVAALYDCLGIAHDTRADFFDGAHEIHGVDTFTFLAEKLVPEPPLWFASVMLALGGSRLAKKMASRGATASDDTGIGQHSTIPSA